MFLEKQECSLHCLHAGEVVLTIPVSPGNRKPPLDRALSWTVPSLLQCLSNPLQKAA